MQLNTLIDQAKDLPAVAIVEEVNNALLQNGAVVITAPPGAGKSTLLPLTMLKGLPLCLSLAELLHVILHNAWHTY